MNYFAHGRQFVADPYFLAGTAVPDWLNAVDRRCRVRSRQAAAFADDSDPCLRQLARGIVRHHADDRWFHQTPAFAQLSLELTVTVRDHLAGDRGFRPSFLGHILVEMLLDADLIAADPAQLERYYRAFAALDPSRVAAGVQCLGRFDASRLVEWIPRFCGERFLFDYLEDAKLLGRLNRVMARVRLPDLPATFADLLPAARRRVRERATELLAAENEPISQE
jgi:hypothetical protein